MKVKLNGFTYTLKFVKNLIHADGTALWGECDQPYKKGRGIRIEKALSPKNSLETIIHECLHGIDMDLPEAWVDKTAHDLAVVLWRLGYRKRAK